MTNHRRKIVLGDQRNKPRIFVQIPAYRDPELGATLIDLFAKAKHPELLRILLFWQHARDETLPSCVRRRPNLEIISVPYQKSRGCNWARSIMQKKWCGERYTLLLDSHHRFVPHWDEKTVELYEGLVEKGITRPIITAYLPSYTPELDPLFRERQPLKIYPWQRKGGLLSKLIGHPILNWKCRRAPIGGDFVSLHFLFADGRFNRDVPFDPACYFVGDEVATSIRAFTSGYDIFHPHIVLGWHCYDPTTRGAHWNDHVAWKQQELHSNKRLHRLFRGRLKGMYGLGRRRSPRSYQERLLVELAEEQSD